MNKYAKDKQLATNGETRMRAFRKSPETKKALLLRIAEHRDADELIHGVGWENGKGCAIGCLFHRYDHSYAETQTNVPQMLWRLCDCIFEGLNNGEAQMWPTRFVQAVPAGADLSRVGWQFLHWLLTESGIGQFQHNAIKDVVSQCAAVLVPLTLGQPADVSVARSTESAARSAAASAAAGAARSVASAARSAAASAESAARSAAWSAESAARSAAWSAAWSAESAARSAAWSAAYEQMADKLIELLRSASNDYS